MALQLTSEQRRVLGVLMEKALAAPAYYPMTLNSIVAACNQKSNRDPVVDYSEDVVGRVLYELMEKNLAAQSDLSHGARVNRFEHKVHEQLGWGRRQRAVMAELLLRGPQTLGELRTYTARMIQFPDLQTVSSILDELAAMDPPYTRVLPRQPGKSAVRYDHTIYSEGEQVEPAMERAAPAAEIPTAAPPTGEQAGAVQPPGDWEARLQSGEDAVRVLEERIDNLENEVDQLRRIVEDVQRLIT